MTDAVEWHYNQQLVKLAALSAVRDFIDGEISSLRAEANERLFALNDADKSEKTLHIKHEGNDVATLTVSQGKPKIDIANQDMFELWVSINFPDKIKTVTQVDPEWQKAFFAVLEADGDDVIFPVTGYPVDGLAVLLPKRTSVLRFATAGREYLIKQLAEAKWLANDGSETVQVLLPISASESQE